MTLLWKKIKPNNEKTHPKGCVRFLRVYVSMLVIDEGEVPEFYKILFEILLLYILLLNYFLFR